jgi:hypothetical protein
MPPNSNQRAPSVSSEAATPSTQARVYVLPSAHYATIKAILSDIRPRQHISATDVHEMLQSVPIGGTRESGGRGAHFAIIVPYRGVPGSREGRLTMREPHGTDAGRYLEPWEINFLERQIEERLGWTMDMFRRRGDEDDGAEEEIEGPEWEWEHV